MMKPSDIMVELDDIGIDFTQLQYYDLFTEIASDKRANKYFNWLLGIDDFELIRIPVMEKPILYSDKTKKAIDETLYKEIRKYLFQINFLQDKEKYNPANKSAKEGILEIRRDEMDEEKSKPKVDKSIFCSQISALVWGGNSSYNFSNIQDLYLYQFLDGISRIDKIKEYEGVMQGYYTGNIDKKDISDILERVNWKSDFAFVEPKLETIADMEKRGLREK